jgi:diguanylate cyclase (GGDEF)-like protein
MSLRARLLGLVLLATLLPALLLGWRFFRENDAEVNTAVKTLATSAQTIATDLDHRVQGTAQLHYGLAHSRLLDMADRSACSTYLSDVRAAYPQYTGILTVQPDGALHCDSLMTGRELNFSDRTYFKRAAAGAKGLILEPVFGRLTGNSVLQIAWPARADDGALRFLLVASLNLKSFAEQARQNSRLAPSELLLVSSEGTVMASAGSAMGAFTPGSTLTGTPLLALAMMSPTDEGGTGEVIGKDGAPQVWAMATSPALRAAGLQVLLGQPKADVVAVSHQRLRQGLVVLGGAALLLFAGVWSLAEWGIRRQVERITAMVRNLGAGDLKARIEAPYPRGELGGLMSVVNATADSLQQQRDAIDALDLQLRLAHAREIVEREANEVRLSLMANFDSLTGLPNRTLFHDRLRQAMARAQRSGRTFALMFLDIDRFKNINDSLGHDIGDRLLVAVAQALTGCVRDTDSVGREGQAGSAEGVFRLGGDEFTLLAEDLAGKDSVGHLARRILDFLSQPFVIDEHELFISASIGITLYADDDTPLDELIKQADIAMYRAKALGRDTYFFYDDQLNQAVRGRHELETRLHHALERNEFLLHYQPKADLATGRITGVEALLRWQPPGEALVGPDQFIPILEETGLIVAVGAWVIQEASRQMMAWQREGQRPIDLAVNVSARQFRHQAFIDQLGERLAASGFDPARLEVELTESILIDDSESVREILEGLSAMGVRIAIDDFGTGHSSLRYLKRFNVDTLKIDRSFVKDTPDDPEDSAITAAVVALGHGLGLNVVAEGVETMEQLEFLRVRSCDEWQGYLLSRPLDGAAFACWFAEREAGPARLPA